MTQHSPSFNFHDSYLVRVDLIEKNKISIVFKSGADKYMSTIMHSPSIFICDNLLAGNIVLEFTKQTKKRISKQDFKNIFSKHFVKNDEHENKHIASLLQKILDGDLTIVQVSSSYGAEIVCLVKEIEYETFIP